MKGGCFGFAKCVMVRGEKERRKEGGRERKRAWWMDVVKGVGWHRGLFGYVSHLAAPR